MALDVEEASMFALRKQADGFCEGLQRGLKGILSDPLTAVLFLGTLLMGQVRRRGKESGLRGHIQGTLLIAQLCLRGFKFGLRGYI